MMDFRKKITLLALVLALCGGAGRTDERESAAKLLERTMFSPDFEAKRFHGGEWFGDGNSYLALEPSATPDAKDIVKYQTASGAREVLVAAIRLIPTGGKKPLQIEEYAFSPDGHQLLGAGWELKLWDATPIDE